MSRGTVDQRLRDARPNKRTNSLEVAFISRPPSSALCAGKIQFVFDGGIWASKGLPVAHSLREVRQPPISGCSVRQGRAGAAAFRRESARPCGGRPDPAEIVGGPARAGFRKGGQSRGSLA